MNEYQASRRFIIGFAGLWIAALGCGGQPALQSEPTPGASDSAPAAVATGEAPPVDRSDRVVSERACRQLAEIHEFERCHFLTGRGAMDGFDLHTCARQTTEVLGEASAAEREAYGVFFDCVSDARECDHLEACYQALMTATVGPIVDEDDAGDNDNDSDNPGGP